jgi:hypothetical protein
MGTPNVGETTPDFVGLLDPLLAEGRAPPELGSSH